MGPFASPSLPSPPYWMGLEDLLILDLSPIESLDLPGCCRASRGLSGLAPQQVVSMAADSLCTKHIHGEARRKTAVPCDLTFPWGLYKPAVSQERAPENQCEEKPGGLTTGLTTTPLPSKSRLGLLSTQRSSSEVCAMS